MPLVSLHPLLDHVQELMEIIRQSAKGLDETIFSSMKGGPLDHDNFSKRVFAKDLRESGVPRIAFHDLRHTALTRMVAMGFDIKTVQEIAGHSDIKTTMNYVHLVAGSIKKVPMIFEVPLTSS